MSHMTAVAPHRVRLVIEVDIDPVAHGFDLSTQDAEEIVLAAIDNAEGLQLAAHTAAEVVGTP